MSIRVGINGFGRMGRLAMRVAWDWPELEIVHINEIKGGAECAAHLLEFDTVQGRWEHSAEAKDDKTIVINGKSVGFSEASSPADIEWGELGCDIVIEASGKFKTPEALQAYFDKGVKKVIVAAPVKEGALNIVYGINDDLYEHDKHNLITAASCTTNCLAPVAKVLNDNFGIEEALMTTVHATTATQLTVDGPSRKDFRGGRAALLNIIPASTGAAVAVTKVIPELKGNLTGMAFRVPTAYVSVVDLTVRLAKSTSYEAIKKAFKDASEGELKGILGYTEDLVVSQDFVSDARTSIFDADAGIELNDRFFKIVSWYDNEAGYSNKLVDLAVYAAAL